jgi:hypothetical protein
MAGLALREHGFWDYTTPGAGGMEGYEAGDFSALVDDMARAGMDSVVVVAKWLTTGYRSRLPFLDQHAESPVTRTDNELLRGFMAEAAKRRIKVWLGAVLTMYPVGTVKSAPSMVFSGTFGGFPLPQDIGVYDSDAPEVTEYSVAVVEEMHAQFPGAHGFMLELEHADIALPHRIPAYTAWAKANGRPSFTQIAQPLAPRNPDISAWRDFATESRLRLVRTVDGALRARGFGGQICLLCETGAHAYQVQQAVNLEMLKQAFPQVVALSYDPNYDKSRNRLGIMEMAVEEPKRAGLTTYYLPRGIMTWAGQWPMHHRLEEMWQFEQDDIERFQPHGAWWFGSGTGTVAEGAHVSSARLRQAGFADGRAARAALLRFLAGRRP